MHFLNFATRQSVIGYEDLTANWLEISIRISILERKPIASKGIIYGHP